MIRMIRTSAGAGTGTGKELDRILGFRLRIIVVVRHFYFIPLSLHLSDDNHMGTVARSYPRYFPHIPLLRFTSEYINPHFPYSYLSLDINLDHPPVSPSLLRYTLLDSDTHWICSPPSSPYSVLCLRNQGTSVLKGTVFID